MNRPELEGRTRALPRLRPFAAVDQDAVRGLILSGLGEHFGVVDERLNPDLDDIWASHIRAGDLVIVAELEGGIVGTGTLVAAEPSVGRLVRMSVDSRYRRHGIGRALVAHLVERARERGFRRLLIETNDDWHDAIGLYRACGFVEEERADGSVHLALPLD